MANSSLKAEVNRYYTKIFWYFTLLVFYFIPFTRQVCVSFVLTALWFSVMTDVKVILQVCKTPKALYLAKGNSYFRRAIYFMVMESNTF